MTHEQTRAMIIEIERRLQTMDPTMQIQNKIETDDIVSFLNQYQNMFIKDVYLSKSKVKDDKRLSSKLNNYLSTLYVLDHNCDLIVGSRDYESFVQLPEDYLLYINSMCEYKHDLFDNGFTLLVHNKYINDISDIRDVVYNIANTGFIMRNPIATDHIYYESHINPSNPFLGQAFVIYHDIYSTIFNVTLSYIKTPKYIDIIGEPMDYACELPYECFDDLVQGTIDLYVSTKYKLSQPKTKKKNEDKEQEDEE